MANLKFTIADGFLTVDGGGRTADYSSADYRAKAWRNGDRDGIKVFPINGNENLPRWSVPCYADFALNIDGADVTVTSAALFTERFNAACGTNIGYNTQYCQHIIADTFDLDTSVATQLTTHEKAGYMTISADEDNLGDVFVGDENVDTDSYQLEAGRSVYVELDDLSKYYAYGAVANCRITILGAYKY